MTMILYDKFIYYHNYILHIVVSDCILCGRVAQLTDRWHCVCLCDRDRLCCVENWGFGLAVSFGSIRRVMDSGDDCFYDGFNQQNISPLD